MPSTRRCGVTAHPWTCGECVEAGRRGTCAPARCYCGHEGCHAFASWEPRKAPTLTAVPRIQGPSAWAAREESTWIDKL